MRPADFHIFLLLMLFSVGVSASAADADAPVHGAVVYAEHCAVCHLNGTGLEDVYPGLQGNDLVLGDPVELIRIIVAGSAGMPAFIYYGYPIAVFWSNEGLTSEEIAKVATFVRTSWGNDAGPVSTKTVNEVISSMEAFKDSSK